MESFYKQKVERDKERAAYLRQEKKHATDSPPFHVASLGFLTYLHVSKTPHILKTLTLFQSKLLPSPKFIC